MACQLQIFFIIFLFMPSTPGKKAPPSNNTRIDQFFRPINNTQTNTSASVVNSYPVEEQKIQPINQTVVVEPVTNPINLESKSDVKMEEEDSDNEDDEIISINPQLHNLQENLQQQQQQPPPPPPSSSQFGEIPDHTIEYEEIPPLNEDFTYTFQYRRYVDMPFMMFDDKKQRIFKVEEWKMFKRIICSNYSNKSDIITVFNRLGQTGIAISFFKKYLIFIIFFFNFHFV